MTYRADALERLDIRAFYAAQGVELGAKVGADEYRFRCPFHDDRTPSANVNVATGLWKCQTENDGGSPIDFLMRLRGIDARSALEAVGEFAGLGPISSYRGRRTAATGISSPGAGSSPAASRPRLTRELVERWHEAALRNTDLMRWFAEKRGFTTETIERWKLGWDGERVTIPIEEAGRLVNVRRYLRDSKGQAGKMIGFAGNNEMRLWPRPVPDSDVLLVEGEWDAILARQMGFEQTMTVTSGAGNFNARWVPEFAGHTVTIAYDNDEAGRSGAQRVAAQLALAEPPASVNILQIPNLPDKGDVTDFFVEQGRTADELRALIADATPYVVGPAADDEAAALTVPLYKAADARYQGQRLLTPVLLSGKAMTPYTVPLRVHVHCDMSNKRYCGICPLAARAGQREITLSARNPAVLSLVGVSDESKTKALKVLAEAVPQCTRPQIEIREWTNIEELRLIPELDQGAQEGDSEYVTRRAFLIGHGTAPNRGYVVDGYAHAHPRDQSTVHLLSHAEPAQDNITSFVLTPELHESLKIFRAPEGEVERRWRAIYDDLRVHVHRIQDRFDMQVAFDLAWHSVIGFTFNDQAVRRGWVEAMVMSDSGQGKTEMAMRLRDHYRLGERVQAEQSSTAGLLGGLEKMGDTWLLSWGRIPLNDKRLLVIDESQGLAAQAIEGLSDVRATGVAEITKIRTDKTNARCRIVWLANPVSGLTLAQHNQGVLAIKDLFKKPEDVRRLDFALCLASGDVDFARAINVRHAADPGQPIYTSDLCRSLVLWAWSRRPDQVVFSNDATGLILHEATEMGRRYHASIPLVEPSDQRLKLARLAAAAAARVYSTDPTGEQLRVEADHVAFVVAYLERIYNARAMAYSEYSGQIRRNETLADSEITTTRNNINAWPNSDEAVAFFRQTKVFKRAELEDVLGWDADYAKAQLRMLTSGRLISPTREGYRKTAAFIALLRDLALSPAVEADLDEIMEGAKF